MIVYQAFLTVSLFMLLTSVILFLIMTFSHRINIYPGNSFVQMSFVFWLATSWICGITGSQWILNQFFLNGQPFIGILIGWSMAGYWGFLHGRWLGNLFR